MHACRWVKMVTSEKVENGGIGRVEQVGEVVHLLPELLWLQELNSPLFEVLQQYYIIFADLVVHFALQVVVRLQVARAHPVGLTLHFVRH